MKKRCRILSVLFLILSLPSALYYPLYSWARNPGFDSEIARLIFNHYTAAVILGVILNPLAPFLLSAAVVLMLGSLGIILPPVRARRSLAVIPAAIWAVFLLMVALCFLPSTGSAALLECTTFLSTKFEFLFTIPGILFGLFLLSPSEQ